MDRTYAKYVCPYRDAHCGVSNTATLASVGSTASLSISSLPLGQSCFYKVMSSCGAPAFMPNDTSRVEIEYIEF